MAKGTKPETAEVSEATPKKSKKKLIIILGLVILLVVGAVVALLLLKPAHPPEDANGDEHASSEGEKADMPAIPPKYVDLGTFTTNLAPTDGEGDRFVQVVISLKISKPELEEMISASKPEILHRVNMLLQSKLPSELVSVEGKAELAEQIKVQIQQILGLAKTAPPIGTMPISAAPQAAPKVKGGLDEVLFTSFLIQ